MQRGRQQTVSLPLYGENMADDRLYDFGLRFKELRKRKGLTQKQLGDKLGLRKTPYLIMRIIRKHLPLIGLSR